MTLLVIDPGTTACGCALFRDTDLVRGYAVVLPGERPRERSPVEPERWRQLAYAVAESLPAPPQVVVIELMVAYGHLKGDPRDLLAVQSVGAMVGACFPSARLVGLEAREWKKQVPRDIFANRMQDRLVREGSWSRVERPGRKTHLNDILHAVGIGLHVIENGVLARM